MVRVNQFFAVYLPAVLLILGAVFYVIGRQIRIAPRRLAASVRPKLSVAFRVLYPMGLRERQGGWRKAGFVLEMAGLIITAAAFLSALGYWYWWLYLRA
jgi:uncharacterized membrane protein YecN with MAPEG domain